MKKSFIFIGLVSITAVTSAFAHDTGIPHEEPMNMNMGGSAVVETKLVPVEGYGRMDTRASATASAPMPRGTQPSQNGAKMSPPRPSTTQAGGSMGASMSFLGSPVVTGNVDVDSKLSTLHKESTAELEKIRVAYRAKVAELTKGMQVSTTAEAGVSGEGKGDARAMMRGMVDASTTAEIKRIMGDKDVQNSFLAQVGLKSDFFRAIINAFIGNK